jgi:dipeptidyl aminopeptidase/acylaminoacyl peptidase
MRTLAVDDLFRIEQIGRYYGGPFSFSPHGGTLAYVLQRPKETATLHIQRPLAGNDRADIWLVELPAGTPRNVTRGRADGVGYWAPAWSPDGARLAMLSNRGGNVRLWVWEKGTGQLRQLTQRGVRLDFFNVPYAWLSTETILCPVLAEGEQPELMNLEVRAPERAMRAWPKAWAGQEVTASVLQSGVPVDLSERPQGQLLLIDAASGTNRVVANGIIQEVTASPDRRLVAFLLAVDVYRPRPEVPLEFSAHYRFTVRMATADGAVREIIPPEVSHDVLGHSLRWSVDGTELAFVSYETSREAPPRIHSVRVADGAVHTFGSGRLDSAPSENKQPQLLWSFQGELIVCAAPLSGSGRPGPTARRDWWTVDREGGERLLTGRMGGPPAVLLAEPGSASFVGLSAGNLWRIRPDGTPPENLTEDVELTLTGIAWPGQASYGDIQVVPTAGAEFRQLILGAESGDLTDYYMVDLPAATLSPLPKPAPKASVAAFDPVRATILFGVSDNTGTYLWSAQCPFGDVHLILETNTFLREIVSGKLEQIDYRSLEGEELKGWLVLPPDHRPGVKRPLVTDLYPGLVYGPSPSPLDHINNSNALNLQILAAHGYAVLQPSMPLPPHGEASDPMLKLTNGVLPAIERAVELGIADPDRLFVLGHSYGGYGVYGLVTQTNRFHAAVALAGFTDLISYYGSFEAWYRYDDFPHEELFQATLLETGQGRMGSPPWKDASRYLLNSPIFFVDRVQTPLLIIHGDMDYIPLQQGEEFFMSLYRQGKRAAFVRYWGEGHVLESPANVRDMWQRILAWFEQASGAGTG